MTDEEFKEFELFLESKGDKIVSKDVEGNPLTFRQVIIRNLNLFRQLGTLTTDQIAKLRKLAE